jgi:hypothetical protein
MSSYTAPESAAKRLADIIAQLDPSIRKLTRTCRAVLRKRLPTAIELVHDNFHALAIGYSPTERMSDCILSLIIHPREVSLSFFYGATLPDPQRILEGTGDQNRFVRLEDASALSRPDVEALIQAAIGRSQAPLLSSGGGYVVIRSVSVRTRSRSVLA